MGEILTIHSNRKTEENFWFKSHKYDSSKIDLISDPTGGDFQKLLTAVPSPFARLHLFETAFTLAIKNFDEIKENIFHKMVSGCFDLFEIVYRIDELKASKNTISIKSFNIEQKLHSLNSSNYKEHKDLSEVFKKYYLSNKKLQEFKNSFFIIYFNNTPIGGSSPFTIFFTSPETNNLPIKRTNGEPYFTKQVNLWDREEDFLISLFSLFSIKNSKIRESAEYVFKYLEKSLNFFRDEKIKLKLQNILQKNDGIGSNYDFSFLIDDNGSRIKILDTEIYIKNIQNVGKIDSPLEIKWDYPPKFLKNDKIKPLVLIEGKDHQNKPTMIKIPTKLGDISKELYDRILPTNNLKYPYIVVSDFLEDYLIRVNYPINHKCFVIPEFDNINKDEDNGFLLPIKKEYFDFFQPQRLSKSLKIIKKSTDSYLVELKIPVIDGEVVFKKHYYENPQQQDAGKVLTADIYFAFYPLFKVKNNNKFNNFYKIMFVDGEQTYKEVDLNIYVDQNIKLSDNINAGKFYKKVIRNEKREGDYAGSIYYETNCPYNFLEVTLKEEEADSKIIKGIILPKWNEIELGNKQFNVAVDFGTTNTHVVLLEEKSNEKTIPQTLTIDENDLQTILFNIIKQKPDKSLSENYERLNSKVENRLFGRLKHEFIPSIIGAGNNPIYKFPIRTAVSTSSNFNAANSQLLGNINVSFIFDKARTRSDENITTDLKWEITEYENETKVKEYIKEILFIVRNKILLNQGNPENSKIVWFKPLSLYKGHQTYYEKIWNELYNVIFRNENNLSAETICITESCAPYFYYSAQNEVLSKNPVLSIDIGGGSTDVSFFLNDKPQFGTSFNFAGNSIWNPGLERRHQVRDEGIFIRYGKDFNEKVVKRLEEQGESELKELFNEPTENIFDRYFTCDHKLKFTDELSRDPNIKFLILLHFSSIIYFCCELLKHKNLNKPEYICLSGRGSKYLSITDPSRDLRLINGYINNFIEDIFGRNDNYKVKLLRKADTEKEATSLGGLFYLERNRNNNNKLEDVAFSENYYGEKDPEFKELNYSQLKNDKKLINSINQNVKKFINIFFDQNDKFNFEQNLTIKLDIELKTLQKYCLDSSYEFLEKGLAKRMQTSKESDYVNEPLFFYPIISMIYELSKMFYDNQNQ